MRYFRRYVRGLLLILALTACTGGATLTPATIATTTTAPPPATTPTTVPPTPSGALTTPPTQPTRAATPRTSGWSARAAVPTPRTECAAAALDGLIYVVGGFLGDGQTTGIAERYDPVTDGWSTIAPLPEGRNHPTLAALGGKLYLVGGYDGAGRPTNTVFAYDPGPDRWTLISTMPGGRAAHGAAVVGERLYVVGGEGPDAATTLAYEPTSGGWTRLAAIPTGRNHLAVAALDGKVYAFGGRIGSRNIDMLEIYDIASDAWSPGPPATVARSGHGAATLGDTIHLTGGEVLDGSGVTFGDLELFAPANATWRRAAPLPTTRHGLGVVAFDGAIWVLAGGPKPGLTVSGAVEVWVP